MGWPILPLGDQKRNITPDPNVRQMSCSTVPLPQCSPSLCLQPFGTRRVATQRAVFLILTVLHVLFNVAAVRCLRLTAGGVRCVVRAWSTQTECDSLLVLYSYVIVKAPRPDWRTETTNTLARDCAVTV